MIDWYGVSINTPEEGIEAIKTARRLKYIGLVALQAIYSIFIKDGFDELADFATKNNVAIMTREVLFRGFLTDKYTDKYDFADSPSAITKLIRLYGKDQIFNHIKHVRNIINDSDISLAQASLRFSLDHPNVTVTLVGISRSKYFEEDWSALFKDLPKGVIESLKQINDIVKV